MSILLALGLALLAPDEQPDAQVSPEENDEVVVITGERVKRRLQDTAASVEAITRREISSSSADNVEQLLQSVPNVVVGDHGQGPAIRGQNSSGVLLGLASFLGGARPRATLEIDGRAAGYQEFVFGNAPLWDVRQVEVFRSPLTVTHGRNSIGGGIVVTTMDPGYDPEVAARVIFGDYHTRHYSVMISGPIKDDQLAVRISGDLHRERTTVDLTDVMRGADPNDDDYQQVRVKFLAEPRGLPRLKIIAAVAHTYSQAAQVLPIYVPFSKRSFPFGGYGIFGVRVNSATIHATNEIDGGQIDAVFSVGDTRARRFAEPGYGESRSNLRDVSGEVFGNLKIADRIILRGGLHALTSRYSQHIDLTNFVGAIGDFRDRQASFGIFAEVEWLPFDRIKLSGGGRYQHDSQDRDGGLAGSFDLPAVFKVDFAAFLPKVSATYALSEKLSAGVLAQKAYNPGGATLSLDTGELDPFKAETLWNYEFFLKGDLKPRLTIAANIFHNAITNAQRGVLVPIVRPDGQPDFLYRYNNVPKASSQGLEVAVEWRPSDKMTVTAGLGLLRTRIRSNKNSDGDLIGRDFERSPKVTAAFAADWRPMPNLMLSANIRHHSRYFSDDFNDRNYQVSRATLVDARMAFKIKRTNAFVYARNIFDRFETSYVFDPEIITAEEPRVIGIGLEARF